MSGGADKQARVKCQKKKKKTFNISQKFDCKSYTGGGGGGGGGKEGGGRCVRKAIEEW